MSNKKLVNLEKILKLAEKEREELKHPYVGSEHLFLALIKKNNSLTDFLNGYDLTYNAFKKELISVVGSCTKDYNVSLYTPLLRKIIKRFKNKQNNNNLDVEENLFASLLDEGEGIAIRIMLRMNIDLDEIYFKIKEKQKIKEMEISNKVGVLLNSIVDLKEKVIGREEEINKLIMTLIRRKKCNPILIGPPGVGKTAIVEELARRIVQNNVPDELKNFKIYMIEMGSLISGTKYRGEFEERLNKIIKEIVSDKKTIIFIDEIHSMIGAGGAEGAINAADILKPYLARGEIKCIGATTTCEYKKSIFKDKALSRRFDVIYVKEPSISEMHELLNKIKKEYESFHNIKIPNKIIAKIIDLSDSYLKNIANPDKSIDLLDSSCAYAKTNGNKEKLTEEDIIKTVFYKTNNFLIDNREFLFKLENDLKDVIDSSNLNKICNSFTFDKSKPISILLNDKSIEEKIVKNLLNINIINIDLNGYSYVSSNSLNDNKTINDSVFNSLIDKPFSLIIFHNILSASKYILDEIISINNKGYILLKDDEKIYFNNAIVIACLNASDKSHTGFVNGILTSKLPSEFVESFKCDIRDLKLKKPVKT